MATSKRVTIFEGPDGGGKTTAAKAYAESVGAMYVHCGVYPGVTTGLARLYAEAMMPAVLGLCDVVMDRSWYSESIYGKAYRDGKTRIGRADCRMLERLAMRCSTLMIFCLPRKETVIKNFLSRKGEEYLDNTDQLGWVYQGYETLMQPGAVALPWIWYDYEEPRITPTMEFIMGGRDLNATLAHPPILSAGNAMGRILMVGEDFGQIKNEDPLYQWPFASFSRQGCSQWLTTQLDEAGIPERDLCWINADQGAEAIDFLYDFGQQKAVYAMGEKAQKICDGLSFVHHRAFHPQGWKRFHATQPYPLIAEIKEYLS